MAAGHVIENIPYAKKWFLGLTLHDMSYSINRKWEREREIRDDSWDMWISQKLFLDRKSVFRDVRDYLGWRHMNSSGIVCRFLKSCCSSIEPLDLLEILEAISNSRIWGKINQSSCFWNVFVEQTAIPLGTLFWILQLCRRLGNHTSLFVTSKNNLTEVDVSQGLHWETPSLSHFLLTASHEDKIPRINASDKKQKNKKNRQKQKKQTNNNKNKKEVFFIPEKSFPELLFCNHSYILKNLLVP